jgi:hypothetical protein
MCLKAAIMISNLQSQVPICRTRVQEGTKTNISKQIIWTGRRLFLNLGIDFDEVNFLLEKREEKLILK